MTDGDIETIDKNGQRVNRVIGEAELNESFSSKEEAVDAGRALARVLGTNHIVRESTPTGVITDPQEDGD